MRLAIIGSRSFNDYVTLCRIMDDWWYKSSLYEGPGTYGIDEVISGGAKGADSLGARWAKDNVEAGIKLTELLPDWDKYGKRAGFIRNEDIVKSADFVLAFWDGISRGTWHSLSIAKRLKKPTMIIYF